jgi:hypothetical protein
MTRSVVYLGANLLFHTIEFRGRRGEFSGELEAAGNISSTSIARDRKSGEIMLWTKTLTNRLPGGTRLRFLTK